MGVPCLTAACCLNRCITQYSAYSAIRHIGSNRAIDPEGIAGQNDLNALAKSCRFMMIYLRSLVSSCLFKPGYAIVNYIPLGGFVRSDDDLLCTLRVVVETCAKAPRIRY